jgi:hypothetical protein
MLPANPTLEEVMTELERMPARSLLLRCVNPDGAEASIEVRLLETVNTQTGARKVWNVSIGEYESQPQAGHA